LEQNQPQDGNENSWNSTQTKLRSHQQSSQSVLGRNKSFCRVIDQQTATGGSNENSDNNKLNRGETDWMAAPVGPKTSNVEKRKRNEFVWTGRNQNLNVFVFFARKQSVRQNCCTKVKSDVGDLGLCRCHRCNRRRVKRQHIAGVQRCGIPSTPRTLPSTDQRCGVCSTHAAALPAQCEQKQNVKVMVMKDRYFFLV
jgi:hypothetical protein